MHIHQVVLVGCITVAVYMLAMLLAAFTKVQLKRTEAEDAFRDSQLTAGSNNHDSINNDNDGTMAA